MSTCINCGSVNAGYDLLCAPCRDNEFNNAPTGEEARSPQEIEDAQIASGLGRSLAGDSA